MAASSEGRYDAIQSQYLTFDVAGEEYAISVLRVREIIGYDVVTRVPTAPVGVRGVINLRGSVVPVVDLAVRFGLGESTVTRLTCIVVVEVEIEGGRVVMGVLADAVRQVVELPPSAIQPPPAFGTVAKLDFLLGMGQSDRKFVLLLDIDRVLSLREIERLPDAASGASLSQEDASGQLDGPAPAPALTSGREAAAAEDGW